MMIPCKHITIYVPYSSFEFVSSRFTGKRDQLHPVIMSYSALTISDNSPLMRKPIKECGLSPRSVHALGRRGIDTIGELVQYSRHQLLQIRNLGVKCADEIEAMLQKIGLKLEAS